jgi:endonuclease/exonuclease/phosphatase (EEP) superfamily protein YafD
MRNLCILLLSCVGWLMAGSGCGNNAPTPVPSAAERIFVDGQFSDWAKVTPVHVDPVGDGVEDGVDFGRLWVGHDRRFVFLRIDLGHEINIQNDNALTLYLDADNNAETGAPVQGLGVDVTWTFGDRSGQQVRSTDTTEIGHADIGLVTAPTVSSTTFEIAFDRDAPSSPFTGDTLRLAVADQQAGGDRLPDASGGVAYPLGEVESLAPLTVPALTRTADSTLRVVSYNVEYGTLFEDEARPAYQRIFDVIQPDLIGFQEIYDRDARAARAAVEELIPSGEDAPWHSAKAGLDLVAVSRYPIRATYTIPGYEDNRSAAFVIDAQDPLGSDLLFIVMHPPCCSGDTPPRDERRQQVVDQVLAFLRDAQTDGGDIDLPANTPVIIAGDMNFVGDDQQPFSLRTGTIVDTSRFGPSFGPDWDGSSLTDLAPRLTGWPMDFTWYDLESSFSPGRLDYIYYTDSVLRAVRHYTLFTPALSAEQLESSGLRADDVVRASDHLPLVADFAPIE